MAQRTVIELFDDLTEEPTPADETVHFGLDGTNYVIDLTSENADELRDALDRFVAAARKERKDGPSVKASGAKRRPTSTKQQSRAIRDWARGTAEFAGLSDRGRIPAAVIEAFKTAHAGGVSAPATEDVPLLLEPTFAG